MAKKLNLVAQNHKKKLEDYNAVLRETGNKEKASFVAECEGQKREIIRRNGVLLKVYDLAVLIGVEYRDLVILLANGLCVNDIKKQYKSREAGEDIKLQDGQSLLALCKRMGLDFTFMYRAIFTYQVTPEEAQKQYQITGGTIPLNWITRKYGPVLEQLGISGIQWQFIVQMVQNNKMTLGEALESNIISRKAIENGISIKLGETVYGVVHMREKIGKDFKSDICINQKEIGFINSCNQELLGVKQRIQGDRVQLPRESRNAGGIEI